MSTVSYLMCYPNHVVIFPTFIPSLVVSGQWKFYSMELAKHGIHMVPIEEELVDKFWTGRLGRPPRPNSPINALPLKYTGITSYKSRVTLKDSY